MTMFKWVRVSRILSIGVLVGFCCAVPTVALEFEAPPQLDPIDVLPSNLVDGPNHRIVQVTNNGIQHEFVMQVGEEQWRAIGELQLRMRVREADALAYLEAMSTTKVFVDGLRDAGVDSVRSLGQLFMNPAETVYALPDGVHRLFRGYIRSTRKGIAETQRVLAGESDATVDPAKFREMNYLLGDAERQWAAELKIDPYTNNLKLRNAISKMAIVEFIGGLPVDFALPPISSAALGVLEEIGTNLYTKDAAQLELDNRACLLEVGIAQAKIESYITSLYSTPSSQTVACAALRRLKDVEQLELLVDRLIASKSFEETSFSVAIISMLAWHHGAVTPLSRIASDGTLPYGISSDAGVVVMFPADHLIWDNTVAAAADNLSAVSSRATQRTLWVLGKVSQQASQALQIRGWNIEDSTHNAQIQTLRNRGFLTSDI